mmetsp:Transcript_78826/g.118494  ORF Transcript_78826/g.118494 Transcript_78826/m.118494 type:complete len:92 (+) Transcript_78826:363-638(+)
MTAFRQSEVNLSEIPIGTEIRNELVPDALGTRTIGVGWKCAPIAQNLFKKKILTTFFPNATTPEVPVQVILEARGHVEGLKRAQVWTRVSK